MATPITQGSVQALDESVAYLSGLYTRAEAMLRDDLEALTRRVLAAAEAGDTTTARFRQRQVRGILARLEGLRGELDGAALEWTRTDLARIYAAGMREGLPVGYAGQPSFTLVHRRALTVLARDTFDDLAGATRYMEANAKRTIREVVKLRVGQRAVAGVPLQGRTRRAVVRDLERRGVSGFVDNAGRRWRLSSYADMAIRTKAAHAYNTGTVLKAEEEGTDLFEIVDAREGPKADPPCAEADGKIADSAWAMSNPVAHPNCVRSFAPRPLARKVSPGYSAGGKASDRIPAMDESELMPLPADLAATAARAGAGRAAAARQGTSGPDAQGPAAGAPAQPLPARAFDDPDDAEAWGRETWGDVDYTNEERNAVRFYQSDNYREVNGALRGTQTMSAKVEREVARLDDALARQPLPEPVETYRGMGKGFRDAFGDDLTGLEYTDPAFYSTSPDPSTAAFFASSDGAVLRLRVPEGTNALYADAVGSELLEFELLLERGARIRIIGRVPDDARPDAMGYSNAPLYDAELVPPPPPTGVTP